jgi:uncharacterized membrane protein
VGLQNRWSIAIPLLLCGLALLVTRRAQALPVYLETARLTYSFRPGGALDRAGCNVCHAGVTNQDSLNFYGKDVQTALNTTSDHMVTPAILHTLDALDSDGDGWPNSAEFKNDTLPGDPASRPAGPPPGSLKPRVASVPGTGSNPISLQSIFLPTHAQHPVIVHFPIALFMFSLFMDLCGVITRNRALNKAAYYNLAAAAVTGVLSVITGLLAWRFAFGGEPLTTDRWLMLHLIFGVVTTILMCLLWMVRLKQPGNSDRPLSNIYIVLGVITFVVIGVTGHFGGIVSGVVK